MKFCTKQPRAKFTNIPYLPNKPGISEEITSSPAVIPENIIIGNNTHYIDMLCSLQARSEFSPVTVSAKYRNEIGDELIQMNFNLYDNTCINLNGIVSHVDIFAKEIISSDGVSRHNDIASLNSELFTQSYEQQVIYTKTFKITEKSQSVRTHETENYSGIDTISDAYYFGGNYKPNKPLSDIQPYLFYLGHNYNGTQFINIISATEFLNTKNKLTPSFSVKFDELSTLQDDIVSGKLQIKVNDKLYKSIYASKDTLTTPVIIVRFKAD